MAPAEPEITEFTPTDQDEVRSLILTGLGEHWGDVDESLNRDLDDIASAYGHGRTVVVRVAGNVIATGTVVPRDRSTAEIVRMAVATDHRRRGLGRLVVDELVATARTWGATAVVLETTSSWQAAVAFYRSCGFAVTHHETGPFGQDMWFRRAMPPGLAEP
jgi:ribosomal protein S18 acetylase RimI-like enzyme